MFNVADESSDSSHEYCDDDCGCSDEDEAYLDQVATRNYEDASKEKADKADPVEPLRYTLKGIDIPIKMLADSAAVPIGIDEQAEMWTECPFPPMVVQTMVTDPIVVTSLGSGTTISASAEAIAILKKHKKNKKQEKKGRSPVKPIPGGNQASGAITPHMRPPPPTPPEHATFPYTLSTPHLPVFHHYTDDALLQQYQVERAKDSRAFDRQTAKIKQYLLNAKIERGGVSFLEESEYSVDLASREDARKVQGMTIQRNRGMTETDVDGGQGGTLNSAKNPQDFSNMSANQTANVVSANEDRLIIRKHNHRSKVEHKPKKPTNVLPTDFDFVKHVAKYITSGSIRHQHSRKVIEDAAGSKTTLMTWIEITQEITVPSADQLSWEDVKTADQNAKDARKEAKDKMGTRAKGKTAKRKIHQDTSDADADTEADKNDNNAAEQPVADADIKELLGAIARIKGTGWLSQGVSLSQYLTELKKDVKHLSKDKGAGAEATDTSDGSE